MKTFGEAFREIIASKGMSVSAVAMELGFRSKTALFRILNEECRITTLKNCMAAARASKLLSLTPQEIERMERGLVISEVGKHTYMMNRVLLSVMQARPPENCGEDVIVEGVEGVSTLSELLERCKHMPELSVSILGQCSSCVLAQLYEIASSLPIHGIRHVMALDMRSPQDIQSFSEAAFMLFLPSYTLGIVHRDGLDKEAWIFSSRMIGISWKNERGLRTMYQLSYMGEQRYACYVDETGALFHHWGRICQKVRGSVDYMKNSEAMDLPFPENYIKFCEQFMHVEAGREILMIKPDIPVVCIPPEIFVGAIADSLGEHAQQMAGEMRRFAQIHAARYENFMKKKKPTHLVVDEGAMRSFAKSGRCTDQVYLARAFTGEERVAILRGLLEKSQEDTSFHLWFGKPGTGTDGREFTAYDGYGVALVKPNTDWQLDGEHQEMMLRSDFLASSFKNLMHTEVLKDEVLPQSETVRILRELIELAGQGKRKEQNAYGERIHVD